jgi:cyclophilin family peptidyl-prolyl cis-trans isomerase
MYKFIIPLFALALLLVSCAKPTTVTPVTTVNPPSPAAAPVRSSDQADYLPNDTAQTLVRARALFDGRYLKGKHVVVLHVRDMGDVTLELNADAAPKTVTNFIDLAKSGYYDNLTFFSITPDFILRAGDPDNDGTGGESIYGTTFADEINADSYGLDKLKIADIAPGQDLTPEIAKMSVKEAYEKQGYHFDANLTSLPFTRGSVAMFNKGPGTNNSQFFITPGDNTTGLQGRYTVFGQVTAGLDVVDKINAAQVDVRGVPLAPVRFKVEVKS